MQKRTAQLAKAIAPALVSVALLIATVPTSVHAQSNTDDQAQRGERPPGGPDMEAAAEKLGVTADDLRAALGGPPPDFEGAAAKLGVSEQALMDAMGPKPR